MRESRRMIARRDENPITGRAMPTGRPRMMLGWLGRHLMLLHWIPRIHVWLVAHVLKKRCEELYRTPEHCTYIVIERLSSSSFRFYLSIDGFFCCDTSALVLSLFLQA